MKIKFFLVLIFLFSSFFYACGEESGESTGNPSSDVSSDTTNNTTEEDTSNADTLDGEDTGETDIVSDTTDPPSLCGNGALDPGETCDDGNTKTEQCAYGERSCVVCADDCDEQPGVSSFCGDGLLQEAEICDDGNSTDDDDCSNLCAIPACGDGILQAPEECDDGNTENADFCLNTCTEAICGDGVLFDAEEECDDGNLLTEVCSYGQETCTVCAGDCSEQLGALVGYCGDGFLNGPEACDDGNTNTEACQYGEPTCTICDEGCEEQNLIGEFCGDSILNGSETCDDGNTNDADDCKNNCSTAACGDGVTGPSEECDDANTIDTDACLTTCQLAACGDGFLQQGVEECDSSGIDSELCDADCTFAICGDGNINAAANEECDDSGESETCNIDCTFSICGDGVQNLTAGEACDDGNTSNSDGCLVSCDIATCGDIFTNVGVEECDEGGVNTLTCDSDCSTPFCSDGHLNTLFGELCDDGNTNNSDACLANCTPASCGDAFTYIGVEDCDSAGIDTPDCNFDCTAAICGDSYLNAEAGEMCDTLELGGTVCTDLPFNSGDLACADTCKFDVSGCKTQFIDLDTGPYVTCGIELDHSILCWGDGGTPLADAIHTPPLGDFLEISASFFHFCALAIDQTVHCWGKDNMIGSPAGIFIKVDTGYRHSCALSGSTKKIECWGDPAYPVSLSPPEDIFKDVAVGNKFACGLHFDGSILCWGENIPDTSSLPLGTGIVASGGEICMFNDLNLECSRGSQSFEPWAFKDVAISFGGVAIVIREIFGAIENLDNNINISPATSFTNISVSGGSSDWNLYAWGTGEQTKSWVVGVEEPFNIPGAYITQLDAGFADGLCRVHLDGHAECVGFFGLSTPPSNAQFLKIGIGYGFGCGLKQDQSILCWGSNFNGQDNYPVGIFDDVSVGEVHACALDIFGNVSCWGGEGIVLGGGTTVDFGQADVTGLLPMKKLALGTWHSCGIELDGNLHCWGDNTYSQLNYPAGVFTDIAAGEIHSCAIDENKEIHCWGGDVGERLSAPVGAFKSISAARVSTCALNTSDEIQCWGSSASTSTHYLDNPPILTGIEEMVVGEGFGCVLHPNGAMECWGKITRKR